MAPPRLSAEPHPPSELEAKSLDEQVQEIKSDVLAIAAELSNLEEKLIYPSNTQVAVFVSMDSAAPAQDTENAHLPIDSAEVSIDGTPVTQHVYSFKELQALSRGGVQRIYTGNLRTGKHSIEVRFSGGREKGSAFEEVQTFEFEKQVDPKALAVVLSSAGSNAIGISIEDW